MMSLGKNFFKYHLLMLMLISMFAMIECKRQKQLSINEIVNSKNANSKNNKSYNSNDNNKNDFDKEIKQIITSGTGAIAAQTKEVTAGEFIRLILMRLIYGLATQMGLEERIAGLFNGALVPPNADDDGDYFDGFDLGDGLDFGLFDGF